MVEDYSRYLEKEESVYLTFDDGPDPEATPPVLELLDKFKVTATFFCIGKNAEKHPSLLESIIRNGHTIGNHSYSHRSAWKIKTEDYLEDIRKANEILPGKLFRPPYGRLTVPAANLLKTEYRIILWNLLSFDFDQNYSPAQCADVVTRNIKPGSVIVFHDRVPLGSKLAFILENVLQTIKERGLECSGIPVP